MKERAASIGATFQLWSMVERGSQIEICLPGKKAYRFPESKVRWLDQLRRFRLSAAGEDNGA